MDNRYGRVEWGPGGTRVRTSAAYWKQPMKWDREAGAEGVRRRVFCASLADVFEDRPELEPWRLDLFALIDRTPGLDWLLLTKRPENIPALWAYFAGSSDPYYPPNVWIGTSVEDQAAAYRRIPELLAIPAAVRFLSVEPMLAPVDLDGWLAVRQGWKRFEGDHSGPDIHWVIVGGESGRGARPMDEEWVRSIRDRCQSANVAFFYKQRLEHGRKVGLPELDGRRWAEFPEPDHART